MKVWITKYALTTGIKCVEVDLAADVPCVNMIVYQPPEGFVQYYHGEGKEWHRTEEAALIRAEQMRIAKVASLKRATCILENMRFTPTKK